MSNLVNVQEALDELGLDQSDYDEFILDLKSFLDEALPELNTAVNSLDYVEIRAKAHAIKGALANLRFVGAAAVAQIIELQGKDSVGTNLGEHFLELSRVLNESFKEIGA